MKVTKAVIPAAGLGTRLLPATKATPKEMLPIVDTPTIQYIIEEAVASGIEDIIIVTGRGKRAIEDHFDVAYELERELELKGKIEELKRVQRISEMADIHYIRQKEPKGLGHAILCARKFIGDSPFAVMLGDDIVSADKPCIGQLIEQYEKTGSSVIGVQEVTDENIHKYGIVGVDSQVNNQNNVFNITNLVEKPSVEEAPSNLAIMGRYVLTPAIMDVLSVAKPGKGNEIQLTDALFELNKREQMLAYIFEGKRHDIGDKFGFVMATVELALNRPDMKEELKVKLNELLKNY